MEPRRRFRFLKELSEGAFGKVYLAEMVTGDNFKSVVAIKLLHGKWAGHEEIVQRSRDEARVLGLLHHRNIIRVEDLTSISGQVAIIMEYLNGVDLKTLVSRTREKGERIPRKVAFDICAQVASALEAAYYHRPLQGGDPLLLIHRDIKPSNVMLTVAGEVKVLDFGTAQARFDDREAHTQALAFGSAAYMAPERLLGDPDAPSGDIFSLGIALYELLAMDGLGKIHIRPEKFEAKLERRLESLDLSDLDAERADQVRTALRLMLAYDATERPTATQVVELLEALADEIHDGSMRRFCREIVAPIRETMEPEQDPDDPLTGSTLFEDSGGLLNRIDAGDPNNTWVDESDDSPSVEEAASAANAAVAAPDLRMPAQPSIQPGHVPDPGATFLPDRERGPAAAPAAGVDPALFSAKTVQHNAGVPDPGSLDAETVRMSPEQARQLVEDEARAAQMPQAHVGSSAANPPSATNPALRPSPAPSPAPAPAPAATPGASHTVSAPGGRRPARQPVAQAGGASGVKLQSARREEPKKGGAGKVIGLVIGLLVLAGAGVGGAIATGVIDLGGGGGGGGTAPTPPAPATAGMQSGGTVQVAELTKERATVRLIVRPPNQATVDIRAAVGDYKEAWDGSGKLELVGLDAGMYKTKVKPKAGGSAQRGTLDIEAGSDCTYIFDMKQGEEWQKDCK